MHDQDSMTADERRRTKPAARGRDDAWEGARRAAAGGDGSTVSPVAMLRLQRLAGNTGVGALVGHEEEAPAESPARSPVLDVVGKGGGSPLPTPVRADMEAHLGADLGDVRVHDDGAAAASAAAVSAKAYTVGNDVVFNSGAYQPHSDDGRQTLAHELTHVVQQRSGPVDGTPTGDGIAVSHPSDRFEQEAEATASSLGPTGDSPASAQREAEEDEEPVQALALQRQEAEEDEEMQALPLQRQEAEEDEEMQALPLQRQEAEEDEEMQALPLQRQEAEEDEEMPA
jgi:hypothetical protein